MTPPADGRCGGEGGIAPPPSTMAPPIGILMVGYPGRGVEMGGDMMGDCVCATTPGDMG